MKNEFRNGIREYNETVLHLSDEIDNATYLLTSGQSSDYRAFGRSFGGSSSGSGSGGSCGGRSPEKYTKN